MLDIVLSQEPYYIGGKIPHLDNYRVYYTGETPKSAIAIINDRIEACSYENCLMNTTCV